MRWIDRSLIRIAECFADYRKNHPSSFRLSPELAIFPQFIFQLRRSYTTNLLVVVQPSPLSYSCNDPPVSALLNVASKFHEDPAHINFKNMLVESQSRFLTVKLNPSATHNSMNDQ
ncbi:hypothetical protein PybrP1_008545, partial [[Pythium] brassicae (nom. inval.)]